MTTLDQFCRMYGIGADRKIVSSKGRVGRVTCIEYSPNPLDGRVWVEVDGTPGNIRLPQSRFRLPEEAQAPKQIPANAN